MSKPPSKPTKQNPKKRPKGNNEPSFENAPLADLDSLSDESLTDEIPATEEIPTENLDEQEEEQSISLGKENNPLTLKTLADNLESNENPEMQMLGHRIRTIFRLSKRARNLYDRLRDFYGNFIQRIYSAELDPWMEGQVWFKGEDDADVAIFYSRFERLLNSLPEYSRFLISKLETVTPEHQEFVIQELDIANSVTAKFTDLIKRLGEFVNQYASFSKPSHKASKLAEDFLHLLNQIYGIGDITEDEVYYYFSDMLMIHSEKLHHYNLVKTMVNIIRNKLEVDDAVIHLPPQKFAACYRRLEGNLYSIISDLWSMGDIILNNLGKQPEPKKMERYLQMLAKKVSDLNPEKVTL